MIFIVKIKAKTQMRQNNNLRKNKNNKCNKKKKLLSEPVILKLTCKNWWKLNGIPKNTFQQAFWPNKMQISSLLATLILGNQP